MEKQLTIEQFKENFTKFGYDENCSASANILNCCTKKLENQIILNFLNDLISEQDTEKWKNILIDKWYNCSVNKIELEEYENALRNKL